MRHKHREYRTMVLILMGDYCGSVAVLVAACIKQLDEEATRTEEAHAEQGGKNEALPALSSRGQRKKRDVF